MGEVPVGEDATNRARPAGETVAGRSTEHATLTEGSVTYDIRFYAQAPRDGTLMEIIVNVEAQNKYNPGYPLIKRGVYYVSRMISAQNGVDFKNGEYGKLKKVCSIWICLNAPKERRNSITRYTLREEQLVGNSVEAAKNYDLISVVMIFAWAMRRSGRRTCCGCWMCCYRRSARQKRKSRSWKKNLRFK